MRNIERKVRGLQIVSVLLICAMLFVSAVWNPVLANAEETDPLSLWTAEAPLKTSLVPYMNAITDETSPDFIPMQDRIAVFDLDGTLCCETDPVYFDHMILRYRVLEDPTYSYKASDFEKEVAAEVDEFAKTGVYPEDLNVKHGQAVASAFSGMTIEQFTNYVVNYRNTPVNGYYGMTKGDAFYLPMVQVVNYLQANGFTVYIVSGTDRFIVRGLVAGKLPILPRNIIGSDETVVATNQGDKDGLQYTYTPEDKLVLGGNFVIKNLKMNKVSVINQEIGQQPVLSFGNSSGDYAMADYVISNNKYKSMAFMLCCDDTVRENGKPAAAEKMYQACNEHGWVPVSMLNDWTTIYGDGVVKK